MREVKEKSEFQFLTKASRRMDRLVGVFLPKSAYRRIAFRQAYEAIDKHRTRKKRDITGGTGDSLLDRHTLDDLRETSRDIMRNNPLVKGLLKTERNGVVGTGPAGRTPVLGPVAGGTGEVTAFTREAV